MFDKRERAPSGQALSASPTEPHSASSLSGNDPSRMSHHEQMIDAQAGCVPCKLCGGNAVIEDAGLGAGYYIRCSNAQRRGSAGCLIDHRRLGGWAYNVRDWWNRLHGDGWRP